MMHGSRDMAAMLVKRKDIWPLSPKPLDGKNWNMAHVKYSPWETSVIIFWWCHRWFRYDVIISQVERFIRSVWQLWGSSRAQLYGGKQLMTSLVRWFLAAILFLNIQTFKYLLLLRNDWTDQGETLQVWSTIHEEQKVLQLWCQRSHGLAAILDLPSNL